MVGGAWCGLRPFGLVIKFGLHLGLLAARETCSSQSSSAAGEGPAGGDGGAPTLERKGAALHPSAVASRSQFGQHHRHSIRPPFAEIESVCAAAGLPALA